MIVQWPTATPATSTMLFVGPGCPTNGTPRSRARGAAAAAAAADDDDEAEAADTDAAVVADAARSSQQGADRCIRWELRRYKRSVDMLIANCLYAARQHSGAAAEVSPMRGTVTACQPLSMALILSSLRSHTPADLKARPA
jgi:hypothetical protein